MNKGLIIGIFATGSLTVIAQTEILNADFEIGVPLTFTIVDNDGLTPNAATAQFTEAWTWSEDPLDTSTNPNHVVGSTSFFEPVGTANRWLITPPLTLGAFGNFFYWNARSHDPSYPDNYNVLVSTTDNQISSFTDTIGLIQQEYATWFSRDVDLSDEGYNNQTIYIAFVNMTDDGFALYVDDIRAVVEDPVGIDELSEISVNVYPNPVSDVLNVQSAANIESLELVSLSGERLMIATESEINVSSLQSGSYFVKVVTDRGSVVKAFVKI